jgi:hypothetical protein
MDITPQPLYYKNPSQLEGKIKLRQQQTEYSKTYNMPSLTLYNIEK